MTWARWILVVAVLIVSVVVGNFLVAQTGPEWAEHAVVHLSSGAVGGFLFSAASSVRRNLRSKLESARRPPFLLVAALAFFTVAQLVEALSAYTEREAAGILHDASGAASLIAFAISLTAAIVWAASALRKQPLPIWITLLLASAMSIAVLILSVGLIP